MIKITENILNYQAWVDEALQSVVKKSLQEVCNRNNTLPGDHHFFISFITKFPGVVLSERLLKKYPTEITIVLQYQFYNLEVGNEGFSVILSFDGIKEKIIVPFAALTAFTDPSVNFRLTFRGTNEIVAAIPSEPFH